MGYVLGGEGSPLVNLYSEDESSYATVELPRPSKLRRWFEPDEVKHKMWDGSIRKHVWGHYFVCELGYDYLSQDDAQLLLEVANHPFRIELYPHGMGPPDDSGTSTGGNGPRTLNDSSKAWQDNEHAGKTVHIVGGTGAGQVRLISFNTPTQLIIVTYWEVVPDDTSQYEINPRFGIDVAYEGDFKLEYFGGKYVGHSGTFRFRSTRRIEDIYFGHKEV